MDATTVNERDVYHTASLILAETWRQKTIVEPEDVSSAVSLAVALRDEVRAACAPAPVAGRPPQMTEIDA